MRIELSLKPQKPTIIEGFPGFGLVGPIVTEFLIDHLKPTLIGEFVYDELPATVAVHLGKLVRPMGVYYSRSHNIVILHTILNPKGQEWAIADEVAKLSSQLKAKEVISIEGVAVPPSESEESLFCHGNPALEKLGAKPMQESIIIGVTAALMLRQPKVSCIFAGTHSAVPDSAAAARVITLLDKHLGLKVDPQPLYAQAEVFEGKLKDMMNQQAKVSKQADEKQMSYLG
ncbi:MAG: PAC2 family protein [Candidatus Woesearchaeota archaeon]